MNVSIITCNNKLVAVVEVSGRLSVDETMLFWAKSQGYEKFPNDCRYSEVVEVKKLGDILLNILPISTIEENRKGTFGE